MKKYSNSIRFTLNGEKRIRVLNRLLEASIECEDICDKNELLSFSAHRSYKKQILEIADRLHCDIETEEQGKTQGVLKKLALSHLGLIIGLVISAVMCFVFSNMILRIRIENDSERVKADILSVLQENGLHIGSFKGSFNFLKLERELKGKVEGISWAGISVQGSTIVIDTIDNIPIPESDCKRMPCNVIALYDCVFDKAEVFEGELTVTHGSGVKAGDIIISGEKTKIIETGKGDNELKEIKQYTRASGRVYGTFEKTAEYYFPYEEKRNTPTGKTKEVSYLNIFDSDIPLFLGDIEGKYTYTESKKKLELFGIKLPIGITNVEYDEYTEAINTFTEDEIYGFIEEAMKKYEQSILSEFEIKSVKKDISKENEGIRAKLTYTLYGEIGEQVDIYLNK